MEEAESGLESKILVRVDLLLDGDALDNPYFNDPFSQTKDLKERFYKLAAVQYEDLEDLFGNIEDRFTRYAGFIPKPELEQIMLNQLDALLVVLDEDVEEKGLYADMVFNLMGLMPETTPPPEGWGEKNTSMEEFMADPHYCRKRINEILKDPMDGMKAAILVSLVATGKVSDVYASAEQIFDDHSDGEINEIASLTDAIAHDRSIPMLKRMKRVRTEIYNQSAYGNLIGENTLCGLDCGLSMEDSLDFAEAISEVELLFLKDGIDKRPEHAMEKYKSNLVALTKEQLGYTETHTGLYKTLQAAVKGELHKMVNQAVDAEIERRVDGWVRHTDLPAKIVKQKLKKEFNDPTDPSHDYINAVKDAALKANVNDAAMTVFKRYGAGIINLGVDTDFKEDVYEHFMMREIGDEITDETFKNVGIALKIADSVKDSYGIVTPESIEWLKEALEKNEGMRTEYFSTVLTIGDTLPTNGHSSDALMYTTATLNLLIAGGTDAEEMGMFADDIENIYNAADDDSTGHSLVKDYVDKIKQISSEAYKAGMTSHSYTEARRVLHAVSEKVQPYVLKAVIEGKDLGRIEHFTERMFNKKLGEIYSNMTHGVKLNTMIDFAR